MTANSCKDREFLQLFLSSLPVFTRFCCLYSDIVNSIRIEEASNKSANPRIVPAQARLCGAVSVPANALTQRKRDRCELPSLRAMTFSRLIFYMESIYLGNAVLCPTDHETRKFDGNYRALME